MATPPAPAPSRRSRSASRRAAFTGSSPFTFSASPSAGSATPSRPTFTPPMVRTLGRLDDRGRAQVRRQPSGRDQCHPARQIGLPQRRARQAQLAELGGQKRGAQIVRRPFPGGDRPLGVKQAARVDQHAPRRPALRFAARLPHHLGVARDVPQRIAGAAARLDGAVHLGGVENGQAPVRGALLMVAGGGAAGRRSLPEQPHSTGQQAPRYRRLGRTRQGETHYGNQRRLRPIPAASP